MKKTAILFALITRKPIFETQGILPFNDFP